LSRSREDKEGRMPGFVKAARLDDVPPGMLRSVDIDGQPVVLANVDGTIYALSGVCSHADGPLGRGKLRGDVLECPFHGGRFAVRSGRAVMLPATEDIPTFEVRIDGADIWVAEP
jgi:nitrite reductase/ring-hydroxylating ferredoxin subunit